LTSDFGFDLANFLKVDVLDNVKHTQVGVIHKDVDNLEKINVDKMVNDKHTLDGVMHDVVECPSQVRVDVNFYDNDGEQVIHNGKERCTQIAAIIKIDDNKENINKEKILFKRACDRIIKSLKKKYYKNFNVIVEDDVNSMFDIGCGDEINYNGVDVQQDDGRTRPRDVFSIVDVIELVDDGLCIPPRWCDVYFGVLDGRDWVFHDGG